MIGPLTIIHGYRQMDRAGLLALLAATLFVFSTDAPAEPIRVRLVAKIIEVSDDHDYLYDSVKIGDTLIATYVYESSVPDQDNSSNAGSYPQPLTNGYGIYVQVNQHHFFTKPGKFVVKTRNDFHGLEDGLELDSPNNNWFSIFVPGETANLLNVVFSDVTGQAVSSDELPLTAPRPSAWEDAYIVIGSAAGSESEHNHFSIHARIESAFECSGKQCSIPF